MEDFNDQQDQRPRNRFLMYKKQGVFCVILLVLFTTGVLGWFVNQANRIPGMESEKDRLKDQNNVLDKMVKDLSKSIDKYKNENEKLDNTVNDIDESLDKFSEINKSLNSNITELNQTIKQLEQGNTIFRLENDNLSQNVTRLNDSIANITGTNSQLHEIITELSNTSKILENANMELNKTLKSAMQQQEQLNESVTSLNKTRKSFNVIIDGLDYLTNKTMQEVNVSSKLVNELTESVVFLNNYNGTQPITEVEEMLAKKIHKWRLLTISVTRNTDDYTVHSFPRILDQFQSFKWVKNKTMPIPIKDDEYNKFKYQVNEILLHEICTNFTQFEKFSMTIGLSQDNISMEELMIGLGKYSKEVLNYYYEKDGEWLAFENEWVESNYTCRLLGDRINLSTFDL